MVQTVHLGEEKEKKDDFEREEGADSLVFLQFQDQPFAFRLYQQLKARRVALQDMRQTCLRVFRPSSQRVGWWEGLA